MCISTKRYAHLNLLSSSFGKKYHNILYGDVNNDGNITVDDVTLLRLYIAGDKSLDANAQLKADVNRDGIIDILDCTEIQLYATGNIPNLG